MRARLTLAFVLALLAASCGEDEGFFSTLTTGSAAAPATTEAGGPSSTPAEGWASTTTFPGAGITTTTAAPVREWAWTRLAADGSFVGGEGDQATEGVAAYEAGVVAVGSDWMGEEFDAAVWTSIDGLAWSRVPHDEAALGGPGRQGMSEVVAGGPGLVAAGFDESGGDRDVAVWSSVDGLAWSRVPHDEAVFGGADDQYALGLVAGGLGLVVAGSDYSAGDGEAAVWVSADGVVWSRLARQSAFGGLGDH